MLVRLAVRWPRLPGLVGKNTGETAATFELCPGLNRGHLKPG